MPCICAVGELFTKSSIMYTGKSKKLRKSQNASDFIKHRADFRHQRNCIKSDVSAPKQSAALISIINIYKLKHAVK